MEAPDWFSAIFSAVFEPVPPLNRVIEVIGSEPYHVSTGFDPVAAITRTWQQVRIIGGTAAAMAIAIAFAGGLAIAQALKPVDAHCRRTESPCRRRSGDPSAENRLAGIQ